MPDSNSHSQSSASSLALPAPPSFPGLSASTTAANLASLLSAHIQEADALRAALTQERQERIRLEKTLANISDPDRAAVARRMQDCEARAERAERARDDAEAHVARMKLGFAELEKYLAMLDVRAADARASFARGFDTGAAGGGDAQPNGVTAQSRTVISPLRPFQAPEPAPFDRRVAPIPRTASSLLITSGSGLGHPAPTNPRVRPRHDSFTSSHPPPPKRYKSNHGSENGHVNGVELHRKPAARSSLSPQPSGRTERANKPISISSTNSVRAPTLTPPPEPEPRTRTLPATDDIDSELARAISGPSTYNSKAGTASNAGSTRLGSPTDDDEITGTASGDVDMLDDIPETGLSDDEIEMDGEEGEEQGEEDELDIDEMILAASAPRRPVKKHSQSSHRHSSRLGVPGLVAPGATSTSSGSGSTLRPTGSSQPHQLSQTKGSAGAAPPGTINAQGLRCCLNCGEPGRYKDGRCVEKWGPGPGGPGTVCDRCRKKIKRTERKDGTSSSQSQSQSQSQPLLLLSQVTQPVSSQQTTAYELSSQSTSGPSQSQPNSSGRSTQASQLSQSQSQSQPSRPASPVPRQTAPTAAGTSQNSNASSSSSSKPPAPKGATSQFSVPLQRVHPSFNGVPVINGKPNGDTKYLSIPSSVASTAQSPGANGALGGGSKSSRSLTNGSSGSPLTPEPRGSTGIVKMEEGEVGY